MAKKRKGKRRIRKAINRWAWRQVTNWADTQRARLRKITRPKVVAQASRDGWARKYPDPRRRPELVMERAEEWIAEFTAVLDNAWRVPFQVDVHERQPLEQAAYEAAERLYGKVARTREIVEMVPENELAESIMEEK
jgi:hypothetical protein